MDELAAVWLGPQSEGDLKQKILLTSFELEAVRMEVDKMKHQSEVNQKQLHAQLQFAYVERDEAKIELQQLLETFMLASTPQAAAQLQTLKQNSPSSMVPIQLAKPHSGVTDLSNDVDSFFDTVSSTEKSCQNLEDDTQQLRDDELNSNASTMMFGAGQPVVDHGSVVIEQLVDGKVLPQKGRLLEAVMTAGPTLQAMMLAGPLPQWKNPPPVQPFGFPPVFARVLQSSLMCPSPFYASPRMDGAIVDLNNERVTDVDVDVGKVLAMGKRPRLL